MRLPACESSPPSPSFFLLLAGCGSVIDADQARICRAVAPALYDEDATIRETSLAPLPEDADTLRLGYTVREDDVTRPHWLTCSFAGRSGVDRFDLVAVDTDSRPLERHQALHPETLVARRRHPGH